MSAVVALVSVTLCLWHEILLGPYRDAPGSCGHHLECNSRFCHISGSLVWVHQAIWTDDNSDQAIWPEPMSLVDFGEFSGIRGCVCRAHGRHRGSCAMPLAGVRHEILKKKRKKNNFEKRSFFR